MALETELKFLDPDLEALRGTLHVLGAVRQGRHFEHNRVYDDPAGSLAARKMLLRLRKAGARCVLTVKRPPLEGGAAAGASEFKVRDEFELAVAAVEAGSDAASVPWGDLEQAEVLLTALGYVRRFTYEKLRETWTLDGCTVCLDELPFGHFVELEGTPESIRACAGRLGLDSHVTSTVNYLQLWQSYRDAHGLGLDDSFVFAHHDDAWFQDESGS